MRQSLPFRAAFWAPLDAAHFPYDRHALPRCPFFHSLMAKRCASSMGRRCMTLWLIFANLAAIFLRNEFHCAKSTPRIGPFWGSLGARKKAGRQAKT